MYSVCVHVYCRYVSVCGYQLLTLRFSILYYEVLFVRAGIEQEGKYSCVIIV